MTPDSSFFEETASLRGQLLLGLGVLLLVALFGTALTVLVWLPSGWSPWIVAGMLAPQPVVLAAA